MDVKIFADIIEPEARAQIKHIAEQPAFADAKIRIMPDVHAGKGCVCGFTANLGDKVVPNLIGVDIGCGMLTLKLGKIDLDLAALDKAIRKFVPSGMNVHSKVEHFSDDASPADCIAAPSFRSIDYLNRSLGTLGGGNHFIEVDVDDEGCKYLIIHCGSRKFGMEVCNYWQSIAVKRCSEVQVSQAEVDALIASL